MKRGQEAKSGKAGKAAASMTTAQLAEFAAKVKPKKKSLAQGA